MKLLMTKGAENMKCLKIKDGKGLFLQKNGEMETVDKMTKNDVLYLLNLATSSDNPFEMDMLQEQDALNEAHKIIYRSLYSKFFELLESRTRFVEESESTYREAIEKYQAN